jgi:hypothetical protein
MILRCNSWIDRRFLKIARRARNDRQLSLRSGSVHGAAMSNQAPLHSVERIFYVAAFLLAVTGLTWYLLR